MDIRKTQRYFGENSKRWRVYLPLIIGVCRYLRILSAFVFLLSKNLPKIGLYLQYVKLIQTDTKKIIRFTLVSESGEIFPSKKGDGGLDS